MNKNPRACAECQKALEDFQKALAAAEEVELALSKIQADFLEERVYPCKRVTIYRNAITRILKGEKTMKAGFVKEKTKNRNQIRAVKKSNKGRKQTNGHREAIKESLREFCAQPATLVKAVNIEDGTTLYFPSGADFARYLGVSRQLVSQALKKWRTNKAVRGWTVSRVGFTEILQGEIVLVENKMLGLSCH